MKAKRIYSQRLRNENRSNLLIPRLTFSTIALGTIVILSGCYATYTQQDAVANRGASNQEVEAIQVTGTRNKQEAIEAKRMRFAQPMADMSVASLSMPNMEQDINPSYTEKYNHLEENGVVQTLIQPVSTFSIDVDTGSYSNVRRMLNQGYLPPKDAIRVEEFVNYFDYQYKASADSKHPFAIDTQVAASPWNKNRLLMRVGLQAKSVDTHDRKAGPKNLVFLLDVSGSMNAPNKLPLVKKALTMLTKQLSEDDSVAIVVYAGASGVVLEPTAANQQIKIERALSQLSAGGSTNGGQGIELAYKLAQQSFNQNGINRVILATDGDFNVGMVDHEQLVSLIEAQREKGIQLTTLGFGQGNYNDHLMEQLANKGDGNYAYIDTLNEARKVLVHQLDATLNAVAKDVKIQVEFNPNLVAEYRLIGYENRALANEDFNNDRVDAGEVGAGHRVTAFYELVMTGGDRYSEPLRYRPAQTDINEGQTEPNTTELAFVKLRYKPIDGNTSLLMSHAIEHKDIGEFTNQSDDFQFATSVVAFAQKLKNSKFVDGLDYPTIIELANQHKGQDDYGYRAEFVSLVRMAETLSSSSVSQNKNENSATKELVRTSH
ncbi:MAG: VWA domain-containing protein [Aliiglaciecola sp.]